MADWVDVVVVGGGIAGSAMATVLARQGVGVLLLERDQRFRDKVRGENLVPWGVAEVQRLGLEDVLLAAGGCYETRLVLYDEIFTREQAEATAVPLDQVLPGVPGAMDVGHPQACEALLRAAEAAGATALRGVSDVRVRPGREPAVTFADDGVGREFRCRAVVGADGRHSTVRRQLGLELRETVPRTMGGGMFVEGLTSWPTNRVSMGTEEDLLYFVFPRPAGQVRLYLFHAIEQRGRFHGSGRQRDFLDAYRFECVPGSDDIAASEPAGPCAFYPMNDSWVDDPTADGVVLIGDAAGWNNPIIGQGLSMAMRDVGIVADLLRDRTQGSAPDFAPYSEEHHERLRRLRITAGS